MFDRTQSTIASVDPEIWSVIQRENQRQEEHIELIASENYASPAVMAAQGTQLTNKYAEGYPGKRYYVGASNLADDGGYAGKVLAEQGHLRLVAGGKIVAINVARPAPIAPPHPKLDGETEAVPVKADAKPQVEKVALLAKEPT